MFVIWEPKFLQDCLKTFAAIDANTKKKSNAIQNTCLVLETTAACLLSGICRAGIFIACRSSQTYTDLISNLQMK